MSLTCPFCAGTSLRYSEPSVQCLECGATGPEGTGERAAILLWDDRKGEPADPPDIRIVETPSLGGVRLELYFGNQELAVVEYVSEDYVQTMRGALTLIGGMRQAEEAEER